jgi:hypothetical protein
MKSNHKPNLIPYFAIDDEVYEWLKSLEKIEGER